MKRGEGAQPAGRGLKQLRFTLRPGPLPVGAEAVAENGGSLHLRPRPKKAGETKRLRQVRKIDLRRAGNWLQHWQIDHFGFLGPDGHEAQETTV